MYEDIGKLLGKGFETWRYNLQLCVPFVLNVFFSILALAPIIAALALVLEPIYSSINLSSTNLSSMGTSPADLSTNEIISLITGHLSLLVPAFILVVLLELFLSAFFTSGAIGMASQAVKEGTTSLSTMWSAGRKNCVKMLFVSILITLITLMGVVFLLPAILAMPSIITSPTAINPTSLGIIGLGVFLLIIYGLAISLLMAVAPYALVVDDLAPVQAIKAGINIFLYNKFDVFMLWLIVIAIGIGLGMLGGSTTASGPAGTQVQPWSFLTGLINLFVLAPLYTIWWTRLYMSRTGKLADEVTSSW